jgi:Xaa-Pro aminopeptidase
MILDKNEQALYIPRYPEYRASWVYTAHDVTERRALAAGFDVFGYTGKSHTSLHIHSYFQVELYEDILFQLRSLVAAGKKLYVAYDPAGQDIRVAQIVDRILFFAPELKDSIVDISVEIGLLRRKKSQDEVELMYKAVQITDLAFRAGAQMIKPEKFEADVQAAIEYIFTESLATPAYQTIVGSGAQSTILHYSQNEHEMHDGELVVVDAGARYEYYCADISRTFPVSGKFSSEQKELYMLVLQVQQEVARLAKPGMWLVNKQEQEASLHHIAVKMFKDAGGYDEWFIHSLGHFIGLDVHDVGNYKEPLAVGDVITLEPGLYIPDAQLGIRIEDNYWLAPQETVCLSQEIPRTCDEIEKMLELSFDVDLE